MTVADDVRISRAIGDDLPELLALLAAVDLPREGVEEYLDAFVVALTPRAGIVR